MMAKQKARTGDRVEEGKEQRQRRIGQGATAEHRARGE
jgi:hypothetical protein